MKIGWGKPRRFSSIFFLCCATARGCGWIVSEVHGQMIHTKRAQPSDEEAGANARSKTHHKRGRFRNIWGDDLGSGNPLNTASKVSRKECERIHSVRASPACLKSMVQTIREALHLSFAQFAPEARSAIPLLAATPRFWASGQALLLGRACHQSRSWPSFSLLLSATSKPSSRHRGVYLFMCVCVYVCARCARSVSVSVSVSASVATLP